MTPQPSHPDHGNARYRRRINSGDDVPWLRPQKQRGRCWITPCVTAVQPYSITTVEEKWTTHRSSNLSKQCHQSTVTTCANIKSP
jgi:hypothetical protein